ncbi:MAG TPA: hypothetical protein VH277_17325 [Gemmatimonadaceae bacterium]|jgi:hypothetical protein|nr:hypothetical protein [Gemmatimonadaceae bacterium]
MSPFRIFVRRALVAGIVGIVSVDALACGDGSTNPRAPQSPASGRPRILSSADRATLDSLRAPLQWMADLHHAAMQEVLHDRNVARYTGSGFGSPACAAQMRYVNRYAQRFDTLAGVHATGRSGNAPIADIGSRVGVCGEAPTFVALPNTAVGRYGALLIAAIRTATVPEDALDAADELLLTAVRDTSLTQTDLSLVAAATTIARSSVMEWYAHGQIARTKELNAGRDVMPWTTSASWDVNGCMAGGTSTAGCTIGAIGASLLSW